MKKIKIFKEFKAFAIKGNMLDIAIGVVIGAAFNKVIDSLVKEVILPPLSLLTDGINLQNKKIILRKAITTEGIIHPEEVSIGYGKLLEAFVDFMIIGFTIFLVVKFIHTLRERAQDPNDKTIETPKDIEILNLIHSELKAQSKILNQNLK